MRWRRLLRCAGNCPIPKNDDEIRFVFEATFFLNFGLNFDKTENIDIMISGKQYYIYL